MAAKRAGLLSRFVTTVSTTVLAPIVVGLVIHRANNLEGRTEAREPAGVVVQGVGWSPEEALQDAVRIALRSSVSSMVDDATWDRHGHELVERLLQEGTGHLLDCQDLRCSGDWNNGREFYRRTVTVTVARGPLAQRLNALVPTVR